MYAEVLTMLVIKQAARDDKRFAFVQDAFCTDKHSVSDRFGGDVIVVTSFGFWIPLQIKRTQQEASVFREESRRRGELVPVVVFNDRHSERQLLESVFQAISEVVPTETESVGRR